MKEIILSQRLRAVSRFVRQDSITADIGTDHGHLICWLAQQGIAKKGYACDVNRLPLERAEATIKEHGLENKVEVVLANGLVGLENKGVTDIIIAGMGGELIANIIGNAPWVKDAWLNFVLQPMTRDHKLRAFLLAEGFTILEEKAVSCGKFLYTVMRVQYSGNKKQINPHYAWTGELWKQNDRDSICYLKNRMEKLSRMEPSFTKNDGYADMLYAWKERLEHAEC